MVKWTNPHLENVIQIYIPVAILFLIISQMIQLHIMIGQFKAFVNHLLDEAFSMVGSTLDHYSFRRVDFLQML